ncbi:S1C family serine protease [Cognatazoarcus halotolerans]|uniref:S1C family serine protease n=1 Tax=Cognatazoarcus halotolerans TaxID=2686016 RepID=UPI001356EE0D|nr:serine protease [Cognatazoarcus halotolerans]MCB1902274.1 trypsin-like peptidase domain-containing protein [Rhodocyclaceae bacterium]MCP5309952.1 trypsin-like peptidase domain-containing protein [Zoogloeaceae bacterium]
MLRSSDSAAQVRMLVGMARLAVAAFVAVGMAFGADRTTAGEQAGLAASVFKKVAPAIVTLHTRLKDSPHDHASGSGFLISRGGRAMTNFHVVADFALEPRKFTLAYEFSNGRAGTAHIVAIDVLNDLAIVQLDANDPHVFSTIRPLSLLPQTAQTNRGDAVFAIGNPRALGITVSGGTYSGELEGTFGSRIHFTGAINPGMSGGPAVNAGGQVVGINVARSTGDEALGFLVPSSPAHALVSASQSGDPRLEANIRDVITEQLEQRQAQLFAIAADSQSEGQPLGPYIAPTPLPRHTECNSGSNDQQANAPASRAIALTCRLKTSVEAIPGIRTAHVWFRHVVLSSRSAGTLNAFQLASMAAPAFRQNLSSAISKSMARQQCADQFTTAGANAELRIRLVWCAQAYRDFPGLYDVQIAIAAQDEGDVLFISRVGLEGVSWTNAVDFTGQFLKGIRHS